MLYPFHKYVAFQNVHLLEIMEWVPWKSSKDQDCTIGLSQGISKDQYPFDLKCLPTGCFLVIEVYCWFSEILQEDNESFSIQLSRLILYISIPLLWARMVQFRFLIFILVTPQNQELCTRIFNEWTSNGVKVLPRIGLAFDWDTSISQDF